MIHPVIQKILLGTVLYGVIMLYCAAAFQIYRKEKKSALVLGSLATGIVILAVAIRMLRQNAG